MKSPVQTVPLGPWPKGIQNVNDLAMTPKGCLAEAVNVYLDSGGVASPRLGYTPVTTGVHSLYRYNGHTYGVLNGVLSELFDSGARMLYGPVYGKLSYGVLNDEVVFTNNSLLGRITADGVKLLGVEAPGPVVATASGNYQAALAFVSSSGEEGPLSAPAACAPGALISVPPPVEGSVAKVRVYQTRENGDILYEVSEFAVGPTTYQITEPKSYGRPAESQYKARMPGGSHVRYWRGRLLVARGRTLYFSDPLRYGLYDPVGGFAPFEARITFIESVETGVFVGVQDVGVYFLHGETPTKWERKLADSIPAQPGASALIPTAQMKLEMQFPPDWVAVWFTSKGFALGLPTGMVLYPQADLLSGLPLGTGSLQFEGDRLIVLSQ